jgi:hypothetical protein
MVHRNATTGIKTWTPDFHLVTQVIYCTLTEVLLNLTEVSPCFFLSCKANVRVKLAKTGHGPYSSTLVVICVVPLLFVLFYVLFVCKCVLPPGDNATAFNKYSISYRTLRLLSTTWDNVCWKLLVSYLRSVLLFTTGGVRKSIKDVQSPATSDNPWSQFVLQF